jgi:hypothetical protein
VTFIKNHVFFAPAKEFYANRAILVAEPVDSTMRVRAHNHIPSV